MKLSKFFIPFILCQVAAFPLLASEPTAEEIRLQNQYIEYRLAQGEIYKVYVKMTDGVTTVQFPSKISEIAGKNISIDGKGTDFQIAVQPDSYYFAVSALKPGATGTLTVTYNRQLYILYLIQSDKEAYASVVFGKTANRKNFTDNVVTKTPKVTPARLVSLIDMAKRYEVLKETYPDSVAGVERALFKNRYRCGKYDIHLDEAIRFEEEDTVIFKLRLINLTTEEIAYDKHSFSAHAGDGIYYMSVSDASGIMPPKSQTYAWFGITSTPRGGRNNLKADNDWLIALTTREMHTSQIQSVKDEIKEKERKAEQAALQKAKELKLAEEKIAASEKLAAEVKKQQEELLRAKKEFEKSVAELQKKLDAEKSAVAKSKSEADQLLKDAEAKVKAAREYEEKVKAKAQAAEKANPASAAVKKAQTAIKSMQQQTAKAVKEIQERTAPKVKSAVPEKKAPAPVPQKEEK